MVNRITPRLGIFEGVPMAEYHAWDAVGSSWLQRLRGKTPAHLRAYLDAEEQPETPSQITGTALHTAMLEPEDFAKRYTIAGQCEATKGDKTRCTNAGTIEIEGGRWACGVKGHAAQLGVAALSGRVPLSPSDLAICHGVQRSIAARMMERRLVASPQRELSIVWTDDATGLLCKARLDLFDAKLEGGTITDLKSCEDASERGFEKAAHRFGYHIKAAHYMAGARAVGFQVQNFAIVAAEKEPPFVVRAFRYTDGNSGALDLGEQHRAQLLATVAECKKSGQWPGYPDDILDLHVPDYAFYEIEGEQK